MPRPRICALDGCEKVTMSGSKYCSPSHRTTYNRRRKAEAKRVAQARIKPTLPEDQVQAATEAAIKEAVEQTIEEALTADVKKALQRAVQLTPKAIDAIEKDLESENEFLRQHAYQTLLKYTIGSQNLVPDMGEDKQPMTVVIEGLARPTEPIVTERQKPHTASELEETLSDDSTPASYRICDSCGQPKPAEEFMGNSNRCTVCFDRIRDSASVAVNS